MFVKSSLKKNFALAFYRYRMWLEQEPIPANEKRFLLRNINHFLAYLTCSSVDFSNALKNPSLSQKALQAFRRFLRSSMHYDEKEIARTSAAVRHFCHFTGVSQAVSAVSSENRHAKNMKSIAARAANTDCVFVKHSSR
jgi:hypothetical protein